MSKIFAIFAFGLTASVTAASSPSAGVTQQLPPGYNVLAVARFAAGKPARNFEIIALGRKDEEAHGKSREAPPRPLFIFERKGDRFSIVGRNDHVVLKADDGVCDPFLDSDPTIATKGRYFTIQNGVASGQHWTDYVTFRLDDQAGFVFYNERIESRTLNPSSDPAGEALVRDGPPRIHRGRPGHFTPFPKWHREH